MLSHSAASCAVVWELGMPALCSTGSAASRTASRGEVGGDQQVLSPSTTLALKIW